MILLLFLRSFLSVALIILFSLSRIGGGCINFMCLCKYEVSVGLV